MCPSEKYFDGYNTIGVYVRKNGYTLMRYYADIHYCGNRKRLFAVRTSGEDIDEFATLNEARRFFDHCVSCHERNADRKSRSEILDEIIRTWTVKGNCQICKTDLQDVHCPFMSIDGCVYNRLKPNRFSTNTNN